MKIPNLGKSLVTGAMSLVLCSGGYAHEKMETEDERFGDLASGRELMQYCTATDSSLVMACFGFLRGVADTTKLAHDFRDSERGTSFNICVPDDLNIAMQARQAVISWAHANGGQLDEPAVVVVISALEQTWSCN